MKRLQQIWNFGINHPWFLLIVVLCLFGVLSLLTLVAVPSRPLMLCVEGLLYLLGGLIILSVVLMFASTFGVFYRHKNVALCNNKEGFMNFPSNIINIMNRKVF